MGHYKVGMMPCGYYIFVVPLVPKPSVVLTIRMESKLSKVFQVATHPRVKPKTFFFNHLLQLPRGKHQMEATNI